jgi:outer membrane protein, heavy metal efflux system
VVTSLSHKKLFLMLLVLFCFSSFCFAEEPVLSKLSLHDATTLFLQNNKELSLAKRGVEGAEADKLSANQKPNPNLTLGTRNFSFSHNGNRNPSNGSNNINDQTLDNTVQISQLFERGDKRAIRTAAAEHEIKAAKFDYKDTLRQQKLALESAYYDLVLAQESEKIQQETVDLYLKSLQAAELRLKAGDISSSDVARIRVDFLRSQNDLRQAVANHQVAQSTLAYIIGKESVANQIMASDAFPSIDAANTFKSADIDENVVNSRPDLLAADARTQQAEESRKLAEALKTRDIQVGVQYERYPGQGPGDSQNTFGATVTIPLFTNYQYQGEIAKAEAMVNTAQDTKDQTKAQAIGEIVNAKAALDSATERVRRYDEQMLNEAKKSADSAEFAYEHGAINVTDLLDSRRVLRAIQLDALTARDDFAKSLATWRAAVQNEDTP